MGLFTVSSKGVKHHISTLCELSGDFDYRLTKSPLVPSFSRTRISKSGFKSSHPSPRTVIDPRDAGRVSPEGFSGSESIDAIRRRSAVVMSTGKVDNVDQRICADIDVTIPPRHPPRRTSWGHTQADAEG